MKLSRYRKAAVAVLGAAAEIATTIPQDSSAWRYAQIIVAVATALGVFGVRNAPTPAEPPPADNRTALFQPPEEKPELRTEPPPVTEKL